jgi:hypothetical protein
MNLWLPSPASTPGEPRTGHQRGREPWALSTDGDVILPVVADFRSFVKTPWGDAVLSLLSGITNKIEFQIMNTFCDQNLVTIRQPPEKAKKEQRTTFMF